LNIIGRTENGELALIKTLDHCSDNNVFVADDSLKALIESQPVQPGGIYLVSHDTINCTSHPVEGVTAWSHPLKLEKLNRIQFRESYVANVGWGDTKIIELTSKYAIYLTPSQ
jgi:hypothetical protein